MRHIPLFFFLFFCTSVNATSWDEPWQEEVIARSQTLALYKVQKSGEQLQLRLIKHLIGTKTQETIEISGYDTGYSSISGDHAHAKFPHIQGRQYYMYLRQDKGQFFLSSPTAGSDFLRDNGEVAGTFRISMHQTSLKARTYERAQICLFKALHEGVCPDGEIKSLILEPLTHAPAPLGQSNTPEQFRMFFRQHIALESAYILRYSLSMKVLEPFLSAKAFHTQVSAVRALSVSKTQNRDLKLCDIIESGQGDGMARVMAVMMLATQKTDRATARLREYEPKAPEKETHLGIGIMDPRIGTFFPRSVRDAIKWYLTPVSKR
ncbi:MAG: hypothetical protein OEZ68_15590 [Gammaproteobacteria bacterium]|nr:hypothetical protein [Gammaproteobacteria bacterium]MDH5802225.1 hypothetical protein [Gammaproteobacteria bacterium]